MGTRFFTSQKGFIGFLLLLLIGAAIAFRHSFMPRSSASSTGEAFHREALRVAVLRGPSVVAVASWLENPPRVGERPLAMKVLDSPELLQAALIKGEADVAMLPLISAANLYNKGVALQMIGCPIWGTLYMVERPTATRNTPLHLFGSGTTPDLLARHYLAQTRQAFPLNYNLRTAHEVAQGLLAKRVDRAVLGEPFLSMVLRKDSTLRIVADLNRPTSSADEMGFAQTAIVCTAKAMPHVAQLTEALRHSCALTNAQPDSAIHWLEQHKVFAPGALDAESIARCRIQFRDAQASASAVEAFLRLIIAYEPRALGGRLPDAHFLAPAP